MYRGGRPNPLAEILGGPASRLQASLPADS
jgi:hypothetical protein